VLLDFITDFFPINMLMQLGALQNFKAQTACNIVQQGHIYSSPSSAKGCLHP
jgi:hypothetical protein